MKKFLTIAIFSIAFLLSSCNSTEPTNSNTNQKVECYKQYDNSTNMWLWYYVIMSNHGNYYYQSTYPINSYSNVNWNTNPGSFDQSTAQSLGETSIPSNGFSEDMQSNFTESNGFESSSTNSTTESSSSTTTSTESESSGFGEGTSSSSGGESGGDSGGGDGGGGE